MTKTVSQKALTDGERYIDDYLPQLSRDMDPCWLADSIDSGRVIACPRCHFLHLPQLLFDQAEEYAQRGISEPVDACDVCAAVPDACKTLVEFEGIHYALDAAAGDVIDERRRRAELIFHLFLSASNGADALVMAALAQSRDTLAVLARTPAHK